MAEVNQIFLSHQELVEVLLKDQDIHEGKWILLVQFGFAAGNVGSDISDSNPTGMVAVTKIGIQRAAPDTPASMIVDASVVNPKPKANPTTKAIKKKAKGD